MAAAYDVDLKHYDELAQLFIPDGELHRPGQAMIGHAQILEAMRKRPLDIETRHLCGPPHFVTATDRTVSSVTYATFYQAKANPDGPPAFDAPAGLLEYHDCFQRTELGWRIAVRQVVVAFIHKSLA